jgi:hypothetical protein
MRSCDRLQRCRHRSNCTLKGIIDQRLSIAISAVLEGAPAQSVVVVVVVVVVVKNIGRAESAHISPKGRTRRSLRSRRATPLRKLSHSESLRLS